MKRELHVDMSRSVPMNVACSQRWLVCNAMILAIGLIVVTTDEASAQEKFDRTVLPVQEPQPPKYSELDARNVTPPPRFEVKAPSGAPNVVIVLIDDIGFGGPSALGGPLQTPTMDRLAKNGLLFNNFHTTALCSPTRMALKTGRNHHTCNTGSIMECRSRFSRVPVSRLVQPEMVDLCGRLVEVSRLRFVEEDWLDTEATAEIMSCWM